MHIFHHTIDCFVKLNFTHRKLLAYVWVNQNFIAPVDFLTLNYHGCKENMFFISCKMFNSHDAKNHFSTSKQSVSVYKEESDIQLAVSISKERFWSLIYGPNWTVKELSMEITLALLNLKTAFYFLSRLWSK